jgi:hypothetical protein
VARLLIVGGGCRGRRLALAMGHEGHAVRITTRGDRPQTEQRRAEIEAAGAECWIGTPDRLATLRAALEGVTVVCWLLASASGSEQELEALHGSRLQFFLGQTIDTTVRGFIYEHGGTLVPAEMLAGGKEIVRGLAERNAIPTAFLAADPTDTENWLMEARSALAALLG